MDSTLKRLGGWALIIGTIVATLGYLAAGLLVHGTDDARYADPAWPVYNGIAVGGDVLIVLGLPVLLSFRGRSRVLVTIGYVGFFAAMVMLNVGEGVIEAFVKPYLASHGGIPASGPTGFTVFEAVALVGVVAGRSAWGSGSCARARYPGGSGCSASAGCSARPDCTARSPCCPTTSCSSRCSRSG